MPFYDYKCKKCGHVQEEHHLMIDKPKLVCKKCKSKKMEKTFSVPQINMNNHPGHSLNEIQ